MNVLEKRAKFDADTIDLRGDEQNAVWTGGGKRSDAMLEGRSDWVAKMNASIAKNSIQRKKHAPYWQAR
jgi:hypothetical protein